MDFLRWLSSNPGRVVQGVVGVVLMTFGLSTRNSWVSSVVFAGLGLLLLIGGLFDLNFLSALMGGPVRGGEIREGEENRI